MFAPNLNNGISYENRPSVEKIVEGLDDPVNRKFTKTGTTIAAAAFKDFIVFAADSRASAGDIIADSNNMKLHKITDSVFIAGSGVSADLDHLTHQLSCEMKQFKAKHGKVLVENTVKPLQNKLFDHFGFLQVGLLHGGFDHLGTHLYIQSPNGCCLKQSYSAEGSGSTYAWIYLKKNYRPDMTVEEAKKMVADAIESGIRNDIYSGNRINLIVLKKVEKKVVKEEFFPYKVVSEFKPVSVPPVALKKNFVVLKSVSRQIVVDYEDVSEKVRHMEMVTN